jgi:hypothetical protein
MEHYVTLFDSLFLPQGLALHLSMERHADSYTLWILCVDDQVFEILQRLQLANVRLLQLSKLETVELLRVKAGRTKGEYCWTLTPLSLRLVFEADPSVERVTYLDADMWFRQSPAPIFRELEASGKQVLITDHAYAPEYDQSIVSGQYCVQFMVFTRKGGEVVRQWWEERCIEWCFARPEDGKFGDQKYLDDWPERFPQQVHVLGDKELLLAPWNATRFPYGRAICWHFHGLRIVKGNSKSQYGVDCGSYPLPLVTRRYIYQEYLNDLRLAIKEITRCAGVVKEQKRRTLKNRLKAFVSGYVYQIWRTTIEIYLPL